MYEICRFLAATAPKAPKVRKPRAPSIRIGSRVGIMGGGDKVFTIAEKIDGKFYVDDADGNRVPYWFNKNSVWLVNA